MAGGTCIEWREVVLIGKESVPEYTGITNHGIGFVSFVTEN